MKYYILTLPIGFNYGGVLQNFALQKVLNSLGYEARTVQFCIPKKILFLSFAKRCIVSILQLFRVGKFRRSYSYQEKKYIWQKVLSFVAEKIKLTPPVTNSCKLRKIVLSEDVAGFIIGSDQVWRPKYTLDISWYFCDFLSSDSTQKRIAFSVSFGVDFNEYSPKQIQMAKRNLVKFTGVSVRETSGIQLCRELFDYPDAVCTLDPTLLLPVAEYQELLSDDMIPRDREVVTYFLDSTLPKVEVSRQIANWKSYVVANLLADNYEYNNSCPKPIVPAVEEWLAHIASAEFVLTDSFHGLVFSILFHRQFVVFCNPQRGNSRIESLLHLLGLQGRMVKDISLQTVKQVLSSEIDYCQADQKLQECRDFAFSFLQDSLG